MMFDTIEQFKQWLTTHAEAPLHEVMAQMDAGQLDAVLAVYRAYGDLGGNADMLTISQSLGSAVADLMQVAKPLQSLGTGAAKKAFVMEHVVALFRLMDRGPDGSAQHVTGSDLGGLPPMFPEGEFESAFVRPLADQGVEEAYKMWKQLGIA